MGFNGEAFQNILVKSGYNTKELSPTGGRISDIISNRESVFHRNVYNQYIKSGLIESACCLCVVKKERLEIAN